MEKIYCEKILGDIFFRRKKIWNEKIYHEEKIRWRKFFNEKKIGERKNLNIKEKEKLWLNKIYLRNVLIEREFIRKISFVRTISFELKKMEKRKFWLHKKKSLRRKSYWIFLLLKNILYEKSLVREFIEKIFSWGKYVLKKKNGAKTICCRTGRKVMSKSFILRKSLLFKFCCSEKFIGGENMRWKKYST